MGFRLDFCTPRYLILRELRLNKLKIGWRIRELRHEEKIRTKENNSLTKICWQERKKRWWKERFV